MSSGFAVSALDRGVHRIVDALGNHAYLVEGERAALLVDTCGGFGDLRSCVEGITSLPVTVALTHGHYDHLAGSYWFDEVRIAPADGGRWDQEEDHASRVHAQVLVAGEVSEDDPFAPRDGSRPRELPLAEGDVFDLGGRTVRAVGLPGHTPGSMGFLLEDARILLSGDAVTPVMCLFFDESLPIAVWRQTLAKMEGLPFDRFYTGHHDHTFYREDLPSFDAAGAYALEDRGMEWRHMRLSEFQGVIHLCPCETLDTESPDFRALIEPWHELPPRMRRRRGARQA